MSNYKHRSHHRFKLGWSEGPVAALDERGSHSRHCTRLAGRWGGATYVPLGCMAPRMPIFQALGGGRGSASRAAIFSSLGFLKVLWLSNVTALKWKLPSVAWLDLGRRQLGREGCTAFFAVSFFFIRSLRSYWAPAWDGDCEGEGNIYWPGCFFFQIQNKTKCCLHNSAHDKANSYD